jgi:hypothetical protein
MWKRIQTLYLAVSTGLIISLFFCRFATQAGIEGSDAVIRYYEKTSYLLILIMLLVANICSLCTFRSPMLQARVSMIAALSALGFQIWLGIDFFRYKDLLTFSVTMLFPLLVAFLNFLAARNAMIDGFTFEAVKKRGKKIRRQKK